VQLIVALIGGALHVLMPLPVVAAPKLDSGGS
jgi:hypothetical protein